MEEKMTLPPQMAKKLLAWYDKGHRDLPWRKEITPYRVWVSEIMLQQTRVETVIPYFHRFMEAFPDVSYLARAKEEEYLKLWEGLGYYRRVRNLHEAAKQVMERFGGEMPGTYPQLRSLPGIGEYTAGAILSIAFEKPKAAVDGNVLRVIARVTQDEREVSMASLKTDVTQALEKIYLKDRCGDFTQSLMELGATVCVPNGEPRCEACPLSDICLAYLQNSTDIFPVKATKKPRKVEQMTVLLLRHEGKLALRKRPEEGLLAGLWELPHLSGHLTLSQVKQELLGMGYAIDHICKGKKAKHIFTHIEWDMQVFEVELKEKPKDEALYFTDEKERQGAFTLPTAFKKVL